MDTVIPAEERTIYPRAAKWLDFVAGLNSLARFAAIEAEREQTQEEDRRRKQAVARREEDRLRKQLARRAHRDAPTLERESA